MRSTIILVFAVLFSITLTAQKVSIIPQPASITQAATGQFVINPATQIVLEGSHLDNSVNFFNDYLQRIYLFKLKVVTKSTGKNVIRLNFERLDNELPGAYTMTVDDKGVNIGGDNEAGVFYGIQSLIQLLPVPDARLKMRPNSLAVPFVTIDDAPRFSYRGLHLDVARHFMPVDFVKRYIDFIALHKMNYFHWHLTDDQGWRIEIKRYPRLTSVGGWRNGTIIGRYPGKGNDGIKTGGFYTQEQIKDVVKYAKARYITIIPEIEMPGHASAAIAAYPELSCFPKESTKHPVLCAWSGDSTGKQVQQTWGVFEDVFCPSEFTFKFFQNVLDEVIALFPSNYIHVGGDECPKESWKRSAFCQQLIKDKGLKDEHGLQSYFISRVEKYLNGKGRKIIGWDEILEGGLAPNATVMSWRGEQGGIDAAKLDHDVIMTPQAPMYFDHTQSQNEDSVTIGGFNPLEKVYAYEPMSASLNESQAKHILGAQANMWTEYMMNTKKVEYMVFPRLSALSEILWSPKEKKNWDDFQERLQVQFKRYDLWNANYSKAYFDLNSSILPTEDHRGVYWKLESKSKQATIKYISPSSGVSPLPYTTPVKIMSTSKSTAQLYTDGTLKASVSQSVSFNKATGKKITLVNQAATNYPGDGPFTLVNGVINEKGLGRSREFLGFNGTNCEAVIDLDSLESVSFVTVNLFAQPASWIYRPQTAEVLGSADGQTYYSLKLTDDFIASKDIQGKGSMVLAFKATVTRFIKVIVTNWGAIPAGNAGAGEKAWLFVDEIEVK